MIAMQVSEVLALSALFCEGIVFLKESVKLAGRNEAHFAEVESKYGDLHALLKGLQAHDVIASPAWKNGKNSILETLKNADSELRKTMIDLGLGKGGKGLPVSGVGKLARKLNKVVTAKKVSACLENLEAVFSRAEMTVLSLDMYRTLAGGQASLQRAISKLYSELCSLASELRAAREQERAEHRETEKAAERTSPAHSVAGRVLEICPLSDSDSTDPAEEAALDAKVEMADEIASHLLNRVDASNLSDLQKTKARELVRKAWKNWELQLKVDFDFVWMEDHVGPLRNRIGTGGHGDVYKGILKKAPPGTPANSPHRPVAIKELRTLFLNPSYKAVFIREADFLREMRHPCIVQFYGACWQKGLHPTKLRPYFAAIVMERMSGSMDEAIRDGILRAESEKWRAVVDITEALEFLHRRGVSHMDIKPGNVLLCWSEAGHWEGRAKLCDFGASRRKRSTLYTISATQSLHPTAGGWTSVYAAPEMHNQTIRRARPFADMWSLGLTICEIFNPSAKQAFGELNVLAKGSRRAFKTAVTQCVSGVPESMRTIVRRCLSPHAARRPTCEEFRSHLDLAKFSLYEMSDPIAEMAADCTFDLAREKLLAQEFSAAKSLFCRASTKGSSRAQFVCNMLYGDRQEGSASGIANRVPQLLDEQLCFDDPEKMQLVVIGWFYEGGIGYEQDIPEAWATYLQAARSGSVAGTTELFRLCETSSDSVGHAPKKVRDILRQASADGDASAQFVLGRCLAIGAGGFSQDVTESLKWLKISAGAGHFRATEELKKRETAEPAGPSVLHPAGMGEHKFEQVLSLSLATESRNSGASRILGMISFLRNRLLPSMSLHSTVPFSTAGGLRFSRRRGPSTLWRPAMSDVSEPHAGGWREKDTCASTLDDID